MKKNHLMPEGVVIVGLIVSPISQWLNVRRIWAQIESSVLYLSYPDCMKSHQFLVFVLLFCLCALYSCKEDEHPKIIDHSTLGHYWVNNQTSYELYMYNDLTWELHDSTTWYDTLVIPINVVKQFDQKDGFLTLAEPWEELDGLEIWRRQNDTIVRAYYGDVFADSFWLQEQMSHADLPLGYKYTLTLTDSMIK
jgi:hypothetical protein